MSETTADTATTSETTETAAATTETITGAATEPVVDYKAEAEKWKGLARKHEEKAKSNADAAKRVAELERENMTELEAAVAKARDETTVSVRAEMGSALAGEAIRAAATGRVADVDALLEGVNPAKFLDDQGNPDRDAITAWMDRVAPKPEAAVDGAGILPPGYYDLAQGARGTAPTIADPLEAALTEITRR